MTLSYKKITSILIMFLFLLLPLKVSALSTEQDLAIQQLIDDACQQSNSPSLSVSIVENNDTFYYSSGFADSNKKIAASEKTLYELASVSKAFTGLAILKLEEDGLLSTKDSISKYLPWLTFKYKGKEVDMKKITLNNFLSHTSGITNKKHLKLIPPDNGSNMLKHTVEQLVGTKLQFLPGEKYEYGTINYDILGLVLEVVTNKKFDDIMSSQIFQPLKLNQTFSDKKKAENTGDLAQGYHQYFFKSHAFNPPNYSGNKPAGYLISNGKDMASWMKIQLGLETDIQKVYKQLIKKSHEPYLKFPTANENFYATGWFSNRDSSIISHEGANPTFTSFVYLNKNDKIGVTLLSNGNTINTDIVYSINSILKNEKQLNYRMSRTQSLDNWLSIATIIFTCLIFVLNYFNYQNNKFKYLKHRKEIRIILVLITIFLLFTLLKIWFERKTYFIWLPYSLLFSLLSLTGVIFSLFHLTKVKKEPLKNKS